MGGGAGRWKRLGEWSEPLPSSVRSPWSSKAGRVIFSLPEKKFWKKSYISYTHVPNLLYLLAISGVGLGVGFGVGCRIGVGFVCFFARFLLFPLHFDVARGRMKTPQKYMLMWWWKRKSMRLICLTASSDFTRSVRCASHNKGSWLEHFFSLLLYFKYNKRGPFQNKLQQ